MLDLCRVAAFFFDRSTVDREDRAAGRFERHKCESRNATDQQLRLISRLTDIHVSPCQGETWFSRRPPEPHQRRFLPERRCSRKARTGVMTGATCARYSLPGLPKVGAEPGKVYRKSRNAMLENPCLGFPVATYHGSRVR